MLFKKDELKLLWPFYVSSLSFGLAIMIMPFMIIYFQGLNLSYFQIAVIYSAVALSAFIFEVPTGSFADIIGRKNSVIIGLLLRAVSAIIIPLTHNFYVLVFTSLLAGAGIAFANGAEQSWVISNLNKLKRKDLHHEYFIKYQAFGAVGAVISPLLGAWIVKYYSISLLWYGMGLFIVLSAIMLFIFGQELYFIKQKSFKNSVKSFYKKTVSGIRFSFTHKIIFLLILSSVFILLMDFGGMGWQPYLTSLSMPNYTLGVVYSLFAVAIIFMPFLSKLFMRYQVKNALILVTLIKMLLIFTLFFIMPPLYVFGAIIFVFYNSINYLADPLYQTYFHKFIPEKIRATVASTQGMLIQLTATVCPLVAGLMMDVYGPGKVLALGGFFGVFAIVTYMKIKD